MQIAYVKIDVTAGILRICDSTSSITCLPRFLPNTAQRSRTSLIGLGSLGPFPTRKLQHKEEQELAQELELRKRTTNQFLKVIISTSSSPDGVNILQPHNSALALRTLHIVHFPNMSSPDKSSPPRDGANGQDEKPRLTEEQKRQNHISSGTFSSHRLQAHPYAFHCMWHTHIPAHKHMSTLARPMYTWGYTVYTRPYVSRGRSGLSLVTPTADG